MDAVQTTRHWLAATGFTLLAITVLVAQAGSPPPAGAAGPARSGQGQTVPAESGSNPVVRTEVALTLFGNQASLGFRNSGPKMLNLSSIEVRWPAENGDLVAVDLNGTTSAVNLEESVSDASSIARIDGTVWVNHKVLQLAPGEAALVSLTFEKAAKSAGETYSLLLSFEDGTFAHFVNGQGTRSPAYGQGDVLLSLAHARSDGAPASQGTTRGDRGQAALL